MTDTKTQNVVSGSITTAFAIVLGFVIYRIIAKGIGDPDLVAEEM